jgi:hypothetical protein
LQLLMTLRAAWTCSDGCITTSAADSGPLAAIAAPARLVVPPAAVCAQADADAPIIKPAIATVAAFLTIFIRYSSLLDSSARDRGEAKIDVAFHRFSPRDHCQADKV